MGKIRTNKRLSKETKKQIFKLRKSGLSFGEITNQLKIKGKNTVFYWAKKIKLTKKQQSDLTKRCRKKSIAALLAQSKENAKAGEERRNKYRNTGFQKAKIDERFRLICALYWAEGSKSKNCFAFVNSDMEMMKVISRWIHNNVKHKNITFEIRYYSENGIPVSSIKKEWTNKISYINTWKIKMFKNEIKRTSQKKGIGKLPYGVGRLSINSTELIQKIHGGIDFLKNMK